MAVKYQPGKSATDKDGKVKEKYPRGPQPSPKDYNGDPWFLYRSYLNG